MLLGVLKRPTVCNEMIWYEQAYQQKYVFIFFCLPNRDKTQKSEPLVFNSPLPKWSWPIYCCVQGMNEKCLLAQRENMECRHINRTKIITVNINNNDKQFSLTLLKKFPIGHIVIFYSPFLFLPSSGEIIFASNLGGIKDTPIPSIIRDLNTGSRQLETIRVTRTRISKD